MHNEQYQPEQLSRLANEKAHRLGQRLVAHNHGEYPHPALPEDLQERLVKRLYADILTEGIDRVFDTFPALQVIPPTS